MGFIQNLKKKAITEAHTTGAIHYVVMNQKTKKYIETPIHCDTTMIWGKHKKIMFIAFPHSVVHDTVVTEQTKPRFDEAEKLYAKYYMARDRNHNLTYDEFIKENPDPNR